MSLRGSTNRADKVASAQPQWRIATPIVLQMHATECGAACLGAVLGFFGRWVPLTELRERCEVSRDGSSAASIARAARHYGLECNGLSVRAEQLKKLELPLILFWQFSHFVVLDGFDKDSFTINDPSSGRRRIPEEEFRKGYSGIALRLAKGADFRPGGEPPGLVSQLRAVLSGSWVAFGGVLACGFLAALLALVIPASLVVVVDGVLQSQGPWGGQLAALLASAALVYIVSAIKHRLVKRLGVRIAVIGANDVVTRLLRLPVEFFDHRMVGDLTDRVSSIDRVSENITERFLLLALDMVMAAVLLVAMFALDAWLTAVVLSLAALHGLAARLLARHRTALSEAMRREQGLLIGVGLQMLSHADTLRMTGADDRFFARWSGQQARELRARRPHAELSAFHAAVPGLIAIFRSAAVLGVGASMVVAGELSLGMLVGFYVLAEMFLAPVGRFLELTGDRQALKTDLQRQGDIAAAAVDPAIKRRRPESKSIPTFNDRLQLTGALELRNVTFGFNKSRPPLIKDFSLVIKPGQRVAVVGMGGIWAVPVFAFLGLGCVFSMKLSNYFQHYGLRRVRLPGGRWEKATPRHSWDADWKYSNWMFFNMQRHADHHAMASRPYPLLQAACADESPVLPGTYADMMNIVLRPKRWFEKMDPLVEQWRRHFYPDMEDWSAYDSPVAAARPDAFEAIVEIFAAAPRLATWIEQSPQLLDALGKL